MAEPDYNPPVAPPPVNAPVNPVPAQAVATGLVLTVAEEEEVERLYEKLKPEGIAEARQHVLSHTPEKLIAAMTAKIEADFPPPPPPPAP